MPLPSRIGLCAFLGSAALLGGAYYFQYVMGLAPCEMCWWQRYPHMVAIAAGLLSVAALGHPRIAMFFALVAITALIVTAGIGVFHAGVEYKFWAGPQAVDRTAQEIPAGRQDDPLRRGGVADVGHLDGGLECYPVGRTGVRAGRAGLPSHP